LHSNLCDNPKEVRHELDLPFNLTSAYSRYLPVPIENSVSLSFHTLTDIQC